MAPTRLWRPTRAAGCSAGRPSRSSPTATSSSPVWAPLPQARPPRSPLRSSPRSSPRSSQMSHQRLQQVLHLALLRVPYQCPPLSVSSASQVLTPSTWRSAGAPLFWRAPVLFLSPGVASRPGPAPDPGAGEQLIRVRAHPRGTLVVSRAGELRETSPAAAIPPPASPAAQSQGPKPDPGVAGATKTPPTVFHVATGFHVGTLVGDPLAG